MNIYSLKQFYKHSPTEQSNRYYYIGDDYECYLKLCKKFPELDISLLNDKFQNKIDWYIQNQNIWLEKLFKKNNHTSFWNTELASHGSSSSALIKNLIFFICTLELLNKNEPTGTTLIVQNPATAIFAKWSHKKNYYLRALTFLMAINLAPSLVYRGTKYFYISIYKLFLHQVRFKTKKVIDKNLFLLRTMITQGGITTDGQYLERHFGELYEHLVKKNPSTYLILWPFNLDMPYSKLIRTLRQLNINFIHPHEYISLWDVFVNYTLEFKNVFISMPDLYYGTDNIKFFLYINHLSTCFSPALLENNLTSLALKNLSKKNNISQFVYTFENSPIEKTPLLYLKKYSPKTLTIGFQHTAWYQSHTGMLFYPFEIKFNPLPDKIITSGKKYLEILPQSGFDKVKIELGKNLRFQQINHIQPVSYSDYSFNNQILVILGHNKSQAYELLQAIAHSLSLTQFNILIRPHPLLNLSQLKTYIESLTAFNYQWGLEPIHDMIKKSRLVIMASGSIANLEVMTFAIPIIRIYLQNDFNFNPLWDRYPLLDYVKNRVDLNSQFQYIESLTPSQHKELLDFSKYVKDFYFESENNNWPNSFSN